MFIERHAAALEQAVHLPEAGTAGDPPSGEQVGDDRARRRARHPDAGTSFPQSLPTSMTFLETTPFPVVLKPADPYAPRVPEKQS